MLENIQNAANRDRIGLVATLGKGIIKHYKSLYPENYEYLDKLISLLKYEDDKLPQYILQEFLLLLANEPVPNQDRLGRLIAKFSKKFFSGLLTKTILDDLKYSPAIVYHYIKVKVDPFTFEALARQEHPLAEIYWVAALKEYKFVCGDEVFDALLKKGTVTGLVMYLEQIGYNEDVVRVLRAKDGGELALKMTAKKNKWCRQGIAV